MPITEDNDNEIVFVHENSTVCDDTPYEKHKQMETKTLKAKSNFKSKNWKKKYKKLKAKYNPIVDVMFANTKEKLERLDATDSKIGDWGKKDKDKDIEIPSFIDLGNEQHTLIGKVNDELLMKDSRSKSKRIATLEKSIDLIKENNRLRLESKDVLIKKLREELESKKQEIKYLHSYLKDATVIVKELEIVKKENINHAKKGRWMTIEDQHELIKNGLPAKNKEIDILKRSIVGLKQQNKRLRDNDHKAIKEQRVLITRLQNELNTIKTKKC